MKLEIQAEFPEGTFIALYGASGAGKTSFLRILAGLMEVDEGRIVVKGKVWLDTRRKIRLSIQDRRIAYVFQDYALFPNMTLRQNLEFALEKKQSPEIIEELLEMIELGELQHQKPQMLSGGQKQRVALARSLVRKPDLLLLDEPLSALDNDMRLKLQGYIRKIHQRFGLTSILVSHDTSEIYKLADQVWWLNRGKIIRQGSPEEVFSGKSEAQAFQIRGEILEIHQEGEVLNLTVWLGNDLIRLKSDLNNAQHFRPGDKILLSVENFKPTIQKWMGIRQT